MKSKLNNVSPSQAKEDGLFPNKRLKIQQSDESVSSLSSLNTPSLETLCMDHVFMRNILPFVGKNQYRYIGAVNRHFRAAYGAVFSTTTTYANVTTVERAKVCFHDLQNSPAQLKILCKVASRKNHLNVLKYLLLQGCTWDAEIATAAARKGHLQLLWWLVRKQCPVDATTFAEAARHSDLAILKWLYALPRETDCPWDESTCSTAASRGHLNVLKWARSKGCPWGPDTCARAALHGHLHVLQWAHHNGCPWNKETCKLAGMVI